MGITLQVTSDNADDKYRRTMVRETGQFEMHPAASQAVISRPPGPAILNENEILERATHHFRLRTRGDLAVVERLVPVPSSSADRPRPASASP